jgi:hypothetical protein
MKHCSWQGVLDTTLCDKICQCLATGRWFSLCTPVSSTNKTNHHDITEILLKVASHVYHKILYLEFQNFVLMCFILMVRFMVFNATFNNISVISWWLVLLVEVKECVLCHWRRNCLRAIQVPTRPQYTYYACTFYRRHFNMKHCSWQGVLDTTLCDKICQCLIADLVLHNNHSLTHVYHKILYLEFQNFVLMCFILMVRFMVFNATFNNIFMGWWRYPLCTRPTQVSWVYIVLAD